MEKFGIIFGRLVRLRRGGAGLSQDELADKADTTKARISDLESGKVANPHAATVNKLCSALNISPEDRFSCYEEAQSANPLGLPTAVLTKLARHFGSDVPDGTEQELVAFLVAKAEEFRELQERLKLLAAPEGRVSELVGAAEVALREGDFAIADDLLREAEAVQLHSSTIVAVRQQAQLRVERGNTALIIGDIETAASHFERAAHYFSGIDRQLEAESRHECANLLRGYAYRYRNANALYAAKSALQINLDFWQKDEDLEQWGRTRNALAAVAVRLSQFDVPDNAVSHLLDAQTQHEEVRAASLGKAPRVYAIAGVDLATVISDRRIAHSDEEHETNLKHALRLRIAALSVISKEGSPEKWGILQHNLGCGYIDLSRSRRNEAESATDIDSAIEHLELSFTVRSADDDGLQYWVASCRSLGEALLNMSELSITTEPDEYVRRASEVLERAAEKISPNEHPNQWAELQAQLARCAARGYCSSL